MHNRSKIFPDDNFPVPWITSCPVDLGELYFCANWHLLNTRAVHLSSSFSSNATVRNRDSTRAMLYLCLTPTFKSTDVSILMIKSLTTILTYMRLIS